MRRLISSGSPFERIGGYSRAVVVGPWVFMAGITGYDYSTMFMPETIEEQTHNCFKTIAATLIEAGSSLNDVVRTNYVVSDAAYADLVLHICGQYFGMIRPASMIIVAGLLKPEMKIEIEVTALMAGAYTMQEVIGDR